MRCFSVLLTCNGKIKINQRTSSPCPKGSTENIRPEVLDFSHVDDDNVRQIYQANVGNFALNKNTHTHEHTQTSTHTRAHTCEKQAINFADTGANIHIFFAQELSVRGPA
jgi:hypothetical protein